jgi:uncharacterized protein with von Willebrand factor type A (vWA) domain
VDAPETAEPLGEPLFLEFFYLLRRSGIPVTTREWLTFVEALDKGLVAASLDRFYAIGRATMVKNERHYDLFDQCFTHFFLGADPPHALVKAVDAWLENPLPLPELTPEELAALEKLDLDELKRRFEETLREQDERHDGGSKWVGTGGRSPFGHSGVNPSGMRVGGEGRSRSAVQVAAQRRFRDYRADLVLDTRQIGVALRKLRKLGRNELRTELDLDDTIDATAKNCGDLEIVMRPPRDNELKLLLLMDVGGSMDPFALLVSRLFSAAHAASHFREFHAMYFHNCVYEQLYKSARLMDGMGTVELTRWLAPDTRLVIVGDAHMAPYELTARNGAIDYFQNNDEPGFVWLERLKKHFTHSVWLNPLSKRTWGHPTINLVSQIFPMFELTLEGLEEAVKRLSIAPHASA